MTRPIRAVLVAVGVILCSVHFQGFANGESVLTADFSTGGIYTDNLSFTQTGKKEVLGISLTPSIPDNYVVRWRSRDLVLLPVS